jgi:DNA-binding FadR family transcriptional regulator
VTLTGVRRGSLVDEVIERLRGQITSGEWPVGARIPPESELVSTLQVGRGTVREAVRALAHAGLLEVRQGDGTFVKARSELAGALQRELAGTTQESVQEVRRAIEVEAARLAAGRRTEADLAACEAALTARAAVRLASTPRDDELTAAWVDADVRFHQAVVAAAHNPLLLELYQHMEPSLRAVLTSMALADDFDQHVYRGHGSLVAALRAGDPARAAREALHNVEALPSAVPPDVE